MDVLQLARLEVFAAPLHGTPVDGDAVAIECGGRHHQTGEEPQHDAVSHGSPLRLLGDDHIEIRGKLGAAPEVDRRVPGRPGVVTLEADALGKRLGRSRGV